METHFKNISIMETNVLELARITLIEEVNQSATQVIEESYEAAKVCTSDFIYK